MPSPNFGPRHAGAQGRVTLVVIHSISLPPGEYGGPAVQELFTNCLDFDSHPAFESLRDEITLLPPGQKAPSLKGP